ncbi:hypothetical protein [Streptomyces sp. NPDC093568]|uniref:hypothetical protein n=1 Tax=Streptomyces sp. NPDC093568 TaxID=3366041 RepID=UPI0038018794
MRRRAASCCLVLLMIPAALVAYFWFTVWHAEHTNDERQRDALASIVRRGHETARDTGRALTASGSSADVDADALTGVIWRHSKAPLIDYDPTRRTFTATVREVVHVDQEAVLLNSGPLPVARCLRFTFAHGSGSVWTSAVAVRDDAMCRASASIASWAHFAASRIGNMDAKDLTLAGARRALDPAGTLGHYDVRTVVRQGGTAVVTVLIRDTRAADATAEQCYRFVRNLDPEHRGEDVTTVPLADCPQAA